MAKKTWKIGEYAKGGIIQATIANSVVELRCLDYYTKEVIFNEWFDPQSSGWHDMEDVLLDWTSFYYAEMIMDWVSAQLLLLNR